MKTFFTHVTLDTWLWTYLWLVRLDTNFWHILQKPALVPCVVLEAGGGAPSDWLGVPKSNPVVLTPFFILSSESLLFSLFATALFTCEAAWLGKLSRNWLKVSAGISCERLRRRFFFNGTRLSSNSRLTVKASKKKIRIPYLYIEKIDFANIWPVFLKMKGK